MDLFDMGDGFQSLLEGMGRVKCPTLVQDELLASCPMMKSSSCSSLIPSPCSLGKKITIWCCFAGVRCDVRYFVSSGTTEGTNKPAHSVWYVGGGKLSTSCDLDCAVLSLPSLHPFSFLSSPLLFPFYPTFTPSPFSHLLFSSLSSLPSPLLLSLLPSSSFPSYLFPALPLPPFTGNTKTAFYELNSVYGHDTFMLDLNNVGAAVKVSNSVASFPVLSLSENVIA